MSYSQEVYDAVSRQLSGASSAIADAARMGLDISFVQGIAQQEIYQVSGEYQRPSVLFKPTIIADGTMWCALLGDDLKVGVAGFGETPDKAMRAFDDAFWKAQTPAAALKAKEIPDDR